MSTTAQQHRDQATLYAREASVSFERSDTDGSLTQWSSGLHSHLESTKASIADEEGTAEFPGLFLLDGRVASTHLTHGEYGPFYVLNDEAAEVLGKRFLSSSSAQNPDVRRRNNRKKGVTVGTIRARAYAELRGAAGATGLSGALSVRPVVLPVVEDLKEGKYDIVTREN